MANIKKFSLIDSLKKANAELTGSPSLLGITSLTYPNYVSSMRANMFTSHTKQCMVLTHPDFPYMFTNNENTVGKYSSGYKKAKKKLEVYRKVFKFEDLVDNPFVYEMFVYDKENDEYDVIHRNNHEDLTETFGYLYNNEIIDSLKEGDVIENDQVLYKSSSYDEYFNYGYGKNLVVAYSFDAFSSEDAAIASESCCKSLESIDSEVVSINLNNNDYLLNLYGNKKNYKVIPDLGEMCSGRIAVSRRLFNKQTLFDFKSDMLTSILDSDNVYYIGNNSMVVDIDIFNNVEERHDNPFYDQINKYLDSQNKYYNEIIEVCEEIMESGSKYSNELDYVYKRALEMVDTEKRWREKDSIYDNINMKITIMRRSPATKGSKVTGRYGNKSVIATVRKDDEMPFTEDGRRVDLILNMLGIINRTTAMPLYEMFINSASYKIRNHMRLCDTIKDKEKILFKYIGLFNEEQARDMGDDYKKKSKKEKEKYIQDAIDDGIYIHQTPLWETKPIFYRCIDVLKEFPFITRDGLYIRKWGKTHRVLTDTVVGEMYCMKLKHSDRRGFSARSTGAIDDKGLPSRSFKSKAHLEKASSSCIRFGEFETLNFSIGVLPEDLAVFHALYRTSINGRKDIVMSMFEEEGVKSIDNRYTSRVAEIFNVILKELGIGVEFMDDDYINPMSDTNLSTHIFEGKTILCSDYKFFIIKRVDEITKEIFASEPIITDSELKERVINTLKTRKYLVGPTEEELDKLDIDDILSFVLK
nr:MAG TPA: bifunctional DNA-directed RNA polymerase subunit beta/beta' [Caudoviricetes sp.]